ncbi:N-formylglutamate amidohydrolase [Curvibacter sp. RS43]|uniref:N-formylglutamate amidohydrolase n=1 Tax=Curvibacter microcysteis TaxID=3026419 RepID=UPI002361AFD6|nr:N-formylglutamate amidohydrolase [Curvibacter sp. RS43]MDD0812926.1 N-formylglutamate amidohydrolase [Curvibacter sp. RS43]
MPLVIDLPHCHGQWASEVVTLAPSSLFASISDTYLEQFWFNAAKGRVPLLLPRFHRALIDANRALTDIDAQMLDGRWRGPLRPSVHSSRGVGLIRRLALPGVPLYEQLLTVSEVRARIVDFYEPYHRALAALIDQAQGAYGYCLHISAQAMKPVGDATNHDPGMPRPDFVVSNLDGVACTPAMTGWVVEVLRSQGFEVWVNSQYTDAELIRRHAQPLLGRQGLQIEINRSLYLDEHTGQPGPCFDKLAPVLQALLDSLAADPQRLAALCLSALSAAKQERTL